MSHYAKVENGIVTQVIVADEEVIKTYPGTWIQTSYNTIGNVHYSKNPRGPLLIKDNQKPLRGNYAGIGHIYDEKHDVFYPPQPSKDHVLNTTTWTWANTAVQHVTIKGKL